MLEQAELRSKILNENQKTHDYFADNHDACCSYIVRKPCRDFYSNMIKSLLKLPERDISSLRVLELGCGTGTWMNLFIKARKAVGVDLSPGMIAVAKQKHPHATFFCADVKSFLEKEIASGNTYDIILSSSFLHHLFDIDEVLDLIAKVLAPQGSYLAIHEPIKALDESKKKSTLGIKINGRLTHLLGYDLDLKANPVIKRIWTVGKSLMPFKSYWTRFRKQPAADNNSTFDFNFVDYKLSDGQTFHPSIFANRVYPQLKISFDLYSYYTFPSLRSIVGESFDYFYVKFDKST
jgi:SAM-dependent methyltransferase